jgi:hypothetical protein
MSFNINVSALWSGFAYAFATIVGSITMLPAGLGITDGSLTYFVFEASKEINIAVAATLITRAVTLWFAVLAACAGPSYKSVYAPTAKGVEEGIIKGIYLFQKGGREKKRVQLMGSGAIFREVIAAAELLAEDWGVDSDLWSVTSFNELTREGQDCDRWNMLHPDKKPRIPYVSRMLEGESGPMIAATDYIKNYAEQLRSYVPGAYKVLGTDGFGRSDTREQLRKHFEVNRFYITVAALKSLADEGVISAKEVVKAIDKYAILIKPIRCMCNGGCINDA